MRGWLTRCVWLLVTLLTSVVTPVYAHGLAQRYALPVPLELYILGAAATVLVSFGVIALFVRGGATLYRYPQFNLMSLRVIGALVHPLTLNLCRFLSVSLFLLVVVAGFIGVESPFKNIAPITVWVIAWVGMAYVSGLCGNFWALINPWAILYSFAESLVHRWRPQASCSLALAYPRWLAEWPAVLLFVLLAWMELVWRHSDLPANVATVVLAYSFITWLGMAVFGRAVWLRHGEVFTLFFGLLSRFSPTKGDLRSQQLLLRPYGVGLLTKEPVRPVLTIFVLLMLATVTFDGFMATPLWGELAQWTLNYLPLRPLLVALQPLFTDVSVTITTLGLCCFALLFFIVYLIFCALMRLAVGGDRIAISEIAGLFVLTLIPIALAYHLAHYLSYLLIVGQYMIPLLSDPFGFGWDLFGTRLYFVDISYVNARFIWLTSVIAIVAGHVCAVYLAHVMALRTLRNSRDVLRSQIPMLVLMVGYTMISLWILAQPVVERG